MKLNKIHYNKMCRGISLTYKLMTYVILKISHQHQYLRTKLDKSMHWSHHIQTLCKKQIRLLNFIWQNLNKCDRSIEASSYLTIIRPLLEYASCVWDPFQVYIIWLMKLKKSKGVLLGGSCWTIVLTAVWQRS